jgi:hypothetical protein
MLHCPNQPDGDSDLSKGWGWLFHDGIIFLAYYAKLFQSFCFYYDEIFVGLSRHW